MTDCFKMAASSRSDVWKYFSKTDEKAVMCEIYTKEFVYHGTTTNLRNHLERTHPDQYKRAGDSRQQAKLITISKKCSKSRTTTINRFLVDVVTKDIRPVRIVEGEGMKALLQFLEPGYEPPSRKHLMKLLHDEYERALPILKKKLSDACGVALTSDVWTSNKMEAYISVTCHFISSQWVMKGCVLKTKFFPERHTGQNISDSIQEIVKDFGIDVTKVMGVVHDTCANAELAGRLMFDLNGWASVQCAAHKLQLAVHEGLDINTIARAIAASRKLVGHFKHSALATAQLGLRQKQMNVPEARLKQDCITRWNSTLYMIQSVLANRWPISAVLGDDEVTKRDDRHLDLRNEQWDLLRELVEPLELIEVATVFLSQEFNVSCSCVYPIIDGLVSSFHPCENDSSTIKNFKKVLSAALKKRWSLDNIDGTKAPAFVSLFDPRLEGSNFWEMLKRIP